jgi:uncharacterized lipoprotein
MRALARPMPSLVFAAAALSAGCAGEDELRCEDTSRYATSVSVPPLRVPDDLTVPDESESLLVPDAASAQAIVPTQCLETPPSYYEQDNPRE